MTRRTLSLQPSEEESGHRALNSLPTHNVQLYQVLRAGHPYPPCRRRPRWPAISASLLSLCVSSVFRGGHPFFSSRDRWELTANCVNAEAGQSANIGRGLNAMNLELPLHPGPEFRGVLGGPCCSAQNCGLQAAWIHRLWTSGFSIFSFSTVGR